MDAEGQVFTLPAGVTEITVGVLGAIVEAPVTDRKIAEARFTEIERRILAIEAMVFPLG